MKKANTTPYQLAIVATSLVMVYFASGIASIAQAAELIKADPIEHVNLAQEAKNSLALSFTTFAVSHDDNQDITINMIAKQKKSAKQNQTMNLTKTALIAD